MPVDFRTDALTFALAAVAIAGVVWTLWRSRGATAWLRVAAYGLLLWFVLEPTAQVVPTLSRKPALAVLVDVSRSMGVEDPDQRLAEAKKLVRRTEAELSKKYELSYYEFSQDSVKSSLKKILSAKPYGSRTDLYESIRQVLRENKAARPAVLVFSDGAQTPGTEEGLPFDTPVYTVGLGHPERLKDIAVREVRGSDFAFKNRPLEVTVKLESSGFGGRRVPVILSERKGKELRQVAVQEVSFPGSPGQAEATLRFTPAAVGLIDYHVEVPVQPDEASRQNNSADFQVQVQREKLRVLYLCGQPSPEYAFLRQILKSDPLIDLVSFVILRNPENIVPVPEDQLSLIPFPVQEIFTTSLPEFDLLIFENFSYQRFGITLGYLENIRRFVENLGGGFLMIGGENSFGRGGYVGTPIETLLPVTMNPQIETVDDGDYFLKILEPQHPILALSDQAAETERMWKSLPALSGRHRLSGVKSGATLLATFQDGAPAIACWQRGRGRVLALATVSTWQWALGQSEKGLFQSAYTHFWRQSLRWLVGSGDSRVLRIVLTEPQWTVGRKAVVKVMLQPDRLHGSRDFQPALSVTGPDGAAQPLALTAASRTEYRAEWTPPAEGDYRLAAEVADGARTVKEARTVSARAVDWERENPAPDFALLRSLAEKSGGRFFAADEFSPDILKGHAQAAQTRSAQAVSEPLWTHPGLFVLALALLLGEWGLRRWRGGI